MSTLFYNGSIITMEEEYKGKEPEAVLISKGVITYVGTLEEAEKKAGFGVKKVDLEGKCLMPSFIDAHSHIAMNGQMSVCADLSECESYDDIINVLNTYITDHKVKKGDFILGFGYDHNFLKEGGHPDKRVLDKVSTDIMIMVMHVSAHMCCVNSAVIEKSGMTADTANPEGGTYGRMEDGKELSGYAEETAMLPFQMILKDNFKADVPAMMKNMQKVYLENGVTTAQDGASSLNDYRFIKAMNDLHQLKMDIVMYPVMGEEGINLMHDKGEKYKDYHGHLKIGGYKLILDGSPQGRTAWMSEPYLEGDETYCGYPWMKTEDVEKYALLAVNEKKQLLVHCNGDAASEQYLNAYEKALKESGSEDDLRPVMIHCQTVRNDQLDRMSQINMVASVFVGHVFYWGDIHMKNFGPLRGNHISPVKDALMRNLHVNFHQDTPVTKPKMLHSVWCAVNRISRNGNVIGEDQKIDVYDALRAVTIEAAYQYFEEDSKGSIKEGKRADLVILDHSPLEVDTDAIKDIQVLETIKDGKTVFSKY